MPRHARMAVGVGLIIGTGCSTTPRFNVLTSQTHWEWQAACCGFAGDRRTPTTEGYRYVLRFHTDGRVFASRDGELVMETGYHLSESADGPTEDPAVTVTYAAPLQLGPGIEPAPGHLVVLLEGGTLLLRNLAPCADCYGDWTFLPQLAQPVGSARSAEPRLTAR